MKPINLFDLYSENKLIEKDFFKDFQKLYRKSDFTLGFQDGPVEDIENIFFKDIGRYAMGFSSGTAALHAASFAIGLTSSDEVIVQEYLYCNSYCSSIFGAKIVADIDDETLNINPNEIAKVISKKQRQSLQLISKTQSIIEN